MPVSSSETKNRWRKRKRGEQSRKPRHQPQLHQDEEDEDYEEEEDADLDQQPEFEDDPINLPDPGAIAGAETEVLSDGAVRISTFPSVVKRTVNRHHYAVIQVAAMERACQAGDSSGGVNSLILENVSHGQLQALSAVPRDAPVLTGEDSEGSYVITPPPIMEGRGVIKRYGSNRVHLVPMHADWFSPTTVNRLERQAVPHFFSGKSTDHTPEKYMDCRNRIVAKYMENPARRLSVADCHGFLAGVDADDVTRVVRFLENWGVINYCAAASVNHHEPRTEDSRLTEDSKGELHVPVTALRSIDSLIQFDKPRCRLKASDVYPELEVDSQQKSDLDSKIREVLSENRCNHCSRSLGIVCYQSLKEIETLLCLSCFNEGAFVAGHSSMDFLKVDSTKDYGDLEADSWTNQETLLLLEAMEQFNENWSEIADHVGTKSKAQCIHHFVRLSIDETPLESIEIPNLPNCNGYANGKASIIEEIEFEDKLPFQKSGNPVMSQVAFLASAVGPRVAAACAHASLAALSNENAGVVDGSGSDNRMISENMNGRDAKNPIQQKVENSGPNNAIPISSEKMRNAVRAGLAAAATKAKLFADHEEREIQRLSANIINHQLKRLELKLKQFAEVESLLIKECEQLERGRQRVSAERALIFSSRPAGLPGVGPSMVNNNPGPSRLPVSGSGSGSPAQPFMSGFAGNQTMHPQMSQQPMFGLGPRLPLSAINPSSSSGSHPMLRPVSGSRSVFE